MESKKWYVRIIYKTEIDPWIWKTKLWLSKEKERGKDKLGVWDIQIYTTIY